MCTAASFCLLSLSECRMLRMNSSLTRRGFVALSSMAVASKACAQSAAPRSLETPFKLNRLVLGPSNTPGAFDEKSVDCPFVFRHDGLWYVTFVAFDGQGYQTGLASSTDLITWKNLGCILKRNSAVPMLKYNIAMNWILRENDLGSEGNLIKVHGQYVGAFHAYPNEGYESGAAVIGLAYSKDLLHWTVGPPVLHAEDGAAWERGGLYKPCLLRANFLDCQASRAVLSCSRR
jgi:hypothetical protein